MPLSFAAGFPDGHTRAHAAGKKALRLELASGRRELFDQAGQVSLPLVACHLSCLLRVAELVFDDSAKLCLQFAGFFDAQAGVNVLPAVS